MNSHHINVPLPAAIAGLVNESVLARYGKLATGVDVPSNNKATRAQLSELTPGCLFDSPISDLAMANGCLSGLWLLHGFLDQSHEISQSLNTPEGSFWHGIMHRTESDFGNSKYWYRQVGTHRVIDAMTAREPNYPNGFVDDCQRAHASGGDAAVADVAIAEWICLFEHGYQNAT